MENPLALYHEKVGATLGNARVPVRFSNTTDEYWIIQRSAGFADISDQGSLLIVGKDRRSFLNGLITNELGAESNDRGVHSLLLNNRARVIADLYLYEMDDSFLADTGDSSPVDTKAFLDRFIVNEDVRITNSTGDLVRLSVQGPKAVDFLKECMSVDLSELLPLHSKRIGPCFSVNRDRTGNGGYDLFMPRSEAEAVWQGFLLKGASNGAGPIGQAALEICRVEKGVPKIGRDVDEGTIVLEAGYADAISYTKGCYLGQEVVARATHVGRVNKRLVQIMIESESVANPGAKLLQGNEEAGAITSAVLSPKTGKGIGLGYVKRDFASVGAHLGIDLDETIASATISKII